MTHDINFQFARFFKEDDTIQPFALLLSQKMREGHICIKVSKEEISTDLGKVSLSELKKVSSNTLAYSNATVPFIYHAPFLYLQRYYRYESKIIDLLKLRMVNSQQQYETRKALLQSNLNIIQSQQNNDDIDNLPQDFKTDWQLIAVVRALLNDFSIITGGPGTGKTTTLSKLLYVLYTLYPSHRVALAAPTGKASMRMKESLRARTADYPKDIKDRIEQLKPFTLHRLLGYQKNSIYFKHNENNPLPFDWVVVDEASMIDMPMFAKLLSACAPDTRLILLGDKDQLASVEAGTLLGDLCKAAEPLNQFSKDEADTINSFIPDARRQIQADRLSSEKEPLSVFITELRYSRRFGDQKYISDLSHAIIHGEADKALEVLHAGSKDQVGWISDADEEGFSNFVKKYYDFMAEENVEEAMKKLNNLRVLVTVKEGNSGLYAINRKIELLMHKLYPKCIDPASSPFYHNRPVIITRNNYELNLFNGDIGLVRRDPDTKEMKVWFENPESGKPMLKFSPASISDCETVFAMTIHKSQGSEFNRVMVVLPENADNPLLTRELIYTGVTRAKEYVVIRGAELCIRTASDRRVERISGIQSRIKSIQ